MIDHQVVASAFRSLYGNQPRLFRAPGRVNLIGEHTDYNDGFVLPVAIDRETMVAAAPRDDRRVRVHSLNLHDTQEFSLDQPGPPQRGQWIDYVEGIAQALLARKVPIGGADLVLRSDVPIGSGLSSSAALEVAVGMALWSLSGHPLDRRTLALAGQAAEHEYAGSRCGIMDQYIASFGRRGHALLIDCRSLEQQPIPMALEHVSIVICDTRVKHSLASSEYNTRRAECEQGLALIKKQLGQPAACTALRDISMETLIECRTALPDLIFRRCRHVVGENQRTLDAVAALQAGNLSAIRALMEESHRSLRDDYQVSCPELDLLVELAGHQRGFLAGRMTGGGFGGCTVNLVESSALESFCAGVAHGFLRAMSREPGIYITYSADGAGEL